MKKCPAMKKRPVKKKKKKKTKMKKKEEKEDVMDCLNVIFIQCPTGHTAQKIHSDLKIHSGAFSEQNCAEKTVIFNFHECSFRACQKSRCHPKLQLHVKTT